MVTVNKQPLDQQIKAFKTSSSFTSGDTLSFSIKFTPELSLPGKFNPETYLTTSNISTSGRVAVICPGNGGLCVEALHRGAAIVAAYEPRNIYHRSIIKVAEFCDAAVGKTFTCDTGKATPQSGIYDLIIWSEGLEDLPSPAEFFTSVLKALRPGGELLIEVAHGTHGLLPTQTNSWKPSIDSFESTIKKLGDYEIASSRPGRNQLRVIYKIRNKMPAPAPIAALVPPPAVQAPAVQASAPELTEIEKLMYEDPVDPPAPPKRRPRKAKQAPPETPPQPPLTN
jgi:SAM-dependent methyltransferase